MKNQARLLSILMVVVLSILACTISPTTPDPNSGLYQTQTAMAMTLTAMNNIQPSPTQYQQKFSTPTENHQTFPTPNDTPFNPIIPTPTETPFNPVIPTPTKTRQTLTFPTPTEKSELSPQEIQQKIASAKMLIYEDMIGDTSTIAVVFKAVKAIGGDRTYVGDAMGTFNQQLASGTDWDLIIVASEWRNAISGDFWTAIKRHIDNGVAVIAEVWYLDQISDGRITPLLNECGLEVQANWPRNIGFNQLDYNMFWIEPNNPVFNTPNKVASFNYSISDPWMGDAGDLLKLTSGSDSKILASHVNGHASDYGLITSCMEGRVLFQTFSSHDYPTNEMTALWQNYITYVLTNRFLTTP
jgi:hypothetical protein